MTDDKNHLGLDKFQLTIIKGNYASMKPSITKRDKALEKIQETTEKFKQKLESAVSALRQEANAYEEQIKMLDTFALEITKKTCGIALTTEQVIKFLENPEQWESYKKEVLGENMWEEETPVETEDTQEQTNWEDAPQELEEAV